MLSPSVQKGLGARVVIFLCHGFAGEFAGGRWCWRRDGDVGLDCILRLCGGWLWAGVLEFGSFDVEALRSKFEDGQQATVRRWPVAQTQVPRARQRRCDRQANPRKAARRFVSSLHGRADCAGGSVRYRKALLKLYTRASRVESSSFPRLGDDIRCECG